MKFFLIILTFMAFLQNAHAQLKGYNVIMVHGFNMEDLTFPELTPEELKQRAPNFWRGSVWSKYAEAYVSFDSKGRIQANNDQVNISKQLFEQFKEISEKKLCDNSCIIVTHSTGDLAVRYFLDNQELWFKNEGLKPIKVLAVLDFAGAGGGSELADLATGVANFTQKIPFVNDIIRNFIGFLPTTDNLGVISDLTINNARNLSVTKPSEIPHLRFAGQVNNYNLFHYSTYLSMLLKGSDDGVIAAHSSCGALYSDAYTSCTSEIGMDGSISSQSAPNKFYHNFYPVFMGDNIGHSQIVEDIKNATVIPISIGKEISPLNLKASTHTEETGWWWFKNRKLTVKNSEKYSFSEVVYNVLNK
jgi:hypothetical protein